MDQLVVDAVIFAQGDHHSLPVAGWSVSRSALTAPTPTPSVGASRRGPHGGKRRQTEVDCSGALGVAMGSDPGNPEWLPRWALGALLIHSGLFPLGELGKEIIHFPTSSTRLYLEGPTLSALGRKGCWEEDKDSHFLPGPLSSLRNIQGLEQFRERGCRLP